ncbi:MAG: Bax inhibitor-1 family protein [Planctomycetota bacterium]|jgi:FtsH-binding integral membrane protein|nr:Bax inhibitor-1 family protein [Planctomycetota bacterium]
MLENSVFARTTTTDSLISPGVYNLIIGATLAYGFGVNYLMVQHLPLASIQSINPFVFIIGYFASCLLGIYLFNKSNNPLVSFLGYNLVVVPFGLIINLAVSRYNDTIVGNAIMVTGGVTVIMMFCGTLFPRFFQRIIGAVTIALIAVIVVQVGFIFFTGTFPPILDWIVVLIFCAYIGYDWGRANGIPKTVDNAVDSAAALYMDIINLFLAILRIMGRRN